MTQICKYLTVVHWQLAAGVNNPFQITQTTMLQVFNFSFVAINTVLYSAMNELKNLSVGKTESNAIAALEQMWHLQHAN